MTKLSICIPVETAAQDVLALVAMLLEKQSNDFEIVIAKPADVALPKGVIELAAGGANISIADAAAGAARQHLWRQAAQAAKGDWVTLINPSDILESDLATMVAFLETTSPNVDALAWNAFPDRPPCRTRQGKLDCHSRQLPYRDIRQDRHAEGFFYWENSLNVPKMPFGLYHAAIRRSLLDVLLQLPEPQDWSTPSPQYEWAAKVLLFANELAFCARPMSAIDIVPFAAQPPLHPGVSLPFRHRPCRCGGRGPVPCPARTRYAVVRRQRSLLCGH